MGRHDLPWRHTDDLYHILISEIMLQQTNVPKVRGKYADFLKRFPTVQTLAGAKQSDILRAWQGLGYNRRALNLHKLAKEVTQNYDSTLPETPQELLTLPGIGPYTSNAVLIFGRNRDLSTVDVNVGRVIRRLHGKREWAQHPSHEDLIASFVPKGSSRDWHGALMDFASSICTKRNPKCLSCPLQRYCVSYPDPDDHIIIKKKEVGRSENGKHIPRRIFRGRIIEALRKETLSTYAIGMKVKSDYSTKKDKKWLEKVLDKLSKEGMIEGIAKKWQLK